MSAHTVNKLLDLYLYKDLSNLVTSYLDQLHISKKLTNLNWEFDHQQVLIRLQIKGFYLESNLNYYLNRRSYYKHIAHPYIKKQVFCREVSILVDIKSNHTFIYYKNKQRIICNILKDYVGTESMKERKLRKLFGYQFN